MLAASAVLVSSAALADKKDQKKDDSQKVVCKTEQFVGSMIPRRICKTKAQWEQGEYDAQRALDQRRLPVDPISLTPHTGG
jgi:hypothetical protein